MGENKTDQTVLVSQQVLDNKRLRLLLNEVHETLWNAENDPHTTFDSVINRLLRDILFCREFSIE